MSTTFKWNQSGFAQVRTLPAVMGRLNAYAQSKAAQGGDGYHAKPAERTGGRGRGRAAVVTDGKGARKEAKYHHLARS